MMMDPARALRVIQEIDKLGVLISIDDFGTGYSSLGYLRDLPVHALKIDRSFVAGMRNNADDRIIVESTAQMGHAMRLELVAEGVETGMGRAVPGGGRVRLRAGVSLLRRHARREVPGMDRGVQCHGDGRQRRYHDNHRAAYPRPVPVRQSSGNEQGRVTSIASKRGRVS